jgi:hypothetical protein
MAAGLTEVGKRKIGADVIDGGHVVRDGTKAEGAVTNQFDLVVEALQSSIRNAKRGPSQNAIEVRAS